MKNTNYNYAEQVGKTFGYLLVQSYKTRGCGAVFQVLCQPCGKIFDICASRVLNNSNISCGCQRGIATAKRNRENRLDLANKIFGKLTVLRVDEEKTNNSNSVYWICQCSCEQKTIKSIKAHHLAKGNTVSCGCIRQDNRGKRNHLWKGYEGISGKFFYCIKRGAKIRNIPFNITIEQIWNVYIKQNKRCALSGLPLTFPKIVGENDGNISLDRINSEKGYLPDNIQIVHKDINFLKGDLPENLFIEYCTKIDENYRSKIESYSI